MLSFTFQNKMLKFFLGASGFLEKNYVNWGKNDPKQVLDAFGGYLLGVGNIVGSASKARANKIEKDAAKQEVS